MLGILLSSLQGMNLALILKLNYSFILLVHKESNFANGQRMRVAYISYREKSLIFIIIEPIDLICSQYESGRI